MVYKRCLLYALYTQPFFYRSWSRLRQILKRDRVLFYIQFSVLYITFFFHLFLKVKKLKVYVIIDIKKAHIKIDYLKFYILRLSWDMQIGFKTKTRDTIYDTQITFQRFKEHKWKNWLKLFSVNKLYFD